MTAASLGTAIVVLEAGGLATPASTLTSLVVEETPMGREIVTERDIQDAQTRADAGGRVAAGTRATAEDKDEYADRLLKNVPAEVIAVYVFILGVLGAADATIPRWLPWGVFGLLLVGTPLYLRRVQKVKKPLQLVLSMGAFAVWVFALGGQSPFATLSWYQPVYGAVLMPLYTFAAAIAKPERPDAA